jgi:primosomal protein N' (replication factor Y)
VWVDSGVFHLDSVFDYSIPKDFEEIIQIGMRVEVPFNGRQVEAFVVGRVAGSTNSKLKSISKVLSPTPVASMKSIILIEAVAQRWAAHPYDVLRSAIPARVANVDKEAWNFGQLAAKRVKPLRQYLQLPAFEDPNQQLGSFVRRLVESGSVLIVVPDNRCLARLHKELPHSIVLDSSLDRTSRYRNFLRAKLGGNLIVLGTRSAVFADIPDLVAILIIDEGSENLYEVRSPGWNARDIAIMRAESEEVQLFFAGYSPSSECSQLIEDGLLDFKASKNKVQVKSFQQEYLELLPGRSIVEIRMALKNGPVLFIAPRKGYAQAITCSKCRNIALCSCGGRLEKQSSMQPINCSLCEITLADWRCSWCQSDRPFLMNRGSARFAQEIGSAFPGAVIHQSEGERILDDDAIKNGIVIATPGSAPHIKSGYAAVVILEGDQMLNQSDLRAQERGREIFFSHCALLSAKGIAIFILSHANPIIGAVAAWKPSLLSRAELRERSEAGLPPFTRAVTLDIEKSESAALLRGLEKSRDENRLPASTRMLGPSELKSGDYRILLLAPVLEGEKLVSLIHEFQRRRSAAKKNQVSVRVDPYSLSR